MSAAEEEVASFNRRAEEAMTGMMPRLWMTRPTKDWSQGIVEEGIVVAVVVVVVVVLVVRLL